MKYCNLWHGYYGYSPQVDLSTLAGKVWASAGRLATVQGVLCRACAAFRGFRCHAAMHWGCAGGLDAKMHASRIGRMLLRLPRCHPATGADC